MSIASRLLSWHCPRGLVPGRCARLPAPGATDPTYAALRGARPDGRKSPAQNLVLERDAFRFQLDSGALYLLAPVDGRTIGAVFVGEGSYRLTPATFMEHGSLGWHLDAGLWDASPGTSSRALQP